jgi:hypothetical protein
MGTYDPYQTEADPTDFDFTDGFVTEVTANQQGEGWTVTWREPHEEKGTWGCFVPLLRDDQPVPEEGSPVRVYGRFGSRIHGIIVNGQCVYYRTPEQRAEHHHRWVENYHREQKERFERERGQLDADYEALPDIFKQRIARFRAEDPDFRWSSEAYEMFCVTQAAMLADHFRNQTGDPLLAIEAIREWDKINSARHDPPYDWRGQLEAVPGWSDGHSGNTHGGSIALAIAYLRHLAGEAVTV